MITLRRARDRTLDRSKPGDAPQLRPTEAIVARFGALEYLEDERLAAGASRVRPLMAGAEVVTYVQEGEMTFDDGAGHRGSLLAGDFRRLTTGASTHLVEGNPSSTDAAHIFHIWLSPVQGEPQPEVEQRRFSIAERRGMPCLIAAPTSGDSSLRIRQDARIYSALLDRGHHVVHALENDRAVWVHVIQGSVTLGGVSLLAGDGAGVRRQRTASITAATRSELLLIDVGAASARAIDSGSDERERPRRYRYG